MKSSQEMKNNGREIRIPNEYLERIDRIIRTGRSVYPSREDFIRSAVEIKLAEMRVGD